MRTERIHCEVAASPGIHVSVQTSFQHLHERITNWVILGATSSQVLQDVRLARIIVWWCSEQYCKDVVHILAVKMDVFSSCSDVRSPVYIDFEEIHLINRINYPGVMDNIAHLQVILRSVLTSRYVFSDLMILISCPSLNLQV